MHRCSRCLVASGQLGYPANNGSGYTQMSVTFGVSLINLKSWICRINMTLSWKETTVVE